MAFSGISSGGLPAYNVSPHSPVHSRPSHKNETRSTTSMYHRSSSSTFASNRRNSLRPYTDINYDTLCSGDQFQDVYTRHSVEVQLHSAASSSRSFQKHSSNNVSKAQKGGASLRHDDKVFDQLPKGHHTNSSLSRLQTLSIRGQSCGHKQSTRASPTNILLGDKPCNDIENKSSPSYKHREASDLDFVARQIASQDGHDCQRSHDNEIKLLTQLFKSLTEPNTSQIDQGLSLLTLAPTHPCERGAQPSTSQKKTNINTSNGAYVAGQSNKRKGKQRENVPDSDSETGQDSGDDRRKREPGNSDIPLGESKKFNLICPFSWSLEYGLLKECSRCLVADLTNMDKFIQHLRRTHHYCFRCGRKFVTKEAFEEHQTTPNQCNGSHKALTNTSDLDNHKKEKGQCSKRGLERVAARYQAIWRSIVPQEPCPGIYATDHVSQFRMYQQVMAVLRKVPERCKSYVLSESETILKKEDKMNDTDAQNLLQLIGICLDFKKSVSYQQSPLNRVSNSSHNYRNVPQLNSDDLDFSPFPTDEGSQNPSFVVFDSSHEDKTDLEHNSNTLWQLDSASGYNSSKYPTRSSPRDTSIPSSSQAAIPYSQNGIEDQLVGNGAHWQVAQPPYPQQVLSQRPTFHPQQFTQAPYGQIWPTQGTRPLRFQPSENETPISTNSTSADPRDHGLFGEVPTQRGFYDIERLNSLRYTNFGSTANGQNAYSTHDVYQQHPYDDQAMLGLIDYDRSSQFSNPSTSMQMPLQSHSTPVTSQNMSRNNFSSSTSSMPDPWGVYNPFPTQQTPHVQQRQQRQKQSQPPSKRPRYDQTR